MTQSLKIIIFVCISVSVVATTLIIIKNIANDTTRKPLEVITPRSSFSILNDLQYKLTLPKPFSTTVPKREAKGDVTGSVYRKPNLLTIKVKRGDTLMKILKVNGIGAIQANSLIISLREIYDLKKLRIGQDIKLTILKISGLHETPVYKAIKLSLLSGFDKEIIVTRQESGAFKGKKVNRKLKVEDAIISGVINFSLYQAAIDNTLPLGVMMELIQIYSFDVDFQREVQQGDEFSVLFSVYLNDQKHRVHTGAISWASLTVSGKKIEYSRFTSQSGVADYYDSRGQSAKKTLMRTPINGAKLTSRYGKRRHPILGYTKVHRGVDFGAPKGVPIMAAGDGIIESIGHNGAYGKYIRIRHNSVYKTAYAHLSKYGKHMKKGHRVRQGTTIGYVGSSGRSTGPHLHYEVIKNGTQTNPMSVRLPAGDKLNKRDLAMYKTHWLKIKKRVSIASKEKN